MQVKFKIIEVNPANHSIVVRYYTDAITPDQLCVQRSESGEILRCRTDFSIDLPVPAPEGAALTEYISARAPRAWFATQEAVADPAIDTELRSLQGLVGQEMAVAEPAPARGFVLQVDTVRS